MLFTSESFCNKILAPTKFCYSFTICRLLAQAPCHLQHIICTSFSPTVGYGYLSQQKPKITDALTLSHLSQQMCIVHQHYLRIYYVTTLLSATLMKRRDWDFNTIYFTSFMFVQWCHLSVNDVIVTSLHYTSVLPGWATVSRSVNAPANRRAASISGPRDLSSRDANAQTSCVNIPRLYELKTTTIQQSIFSD